MDHSQGIQRQQYVTLHLFDSASDVISASVLQCTQKLTNLICTMPVWCVVLVLNCAGHVLVFQCLFLAFLCLFKHYVVLLPEVFSLVNALPVLTVL